jgi:Bacterial Ig-like domain (group 2)
MRYRSPVQIGLSVGLLALGCGGDPVEPHRAGVVDVDPAFSVVPGSIFIDGPYRYSIATCATWSTHLEFWASPPSINWYSANPQVASATGTGVNGATGRVCGLKDGFSSIWAVANPGTDESALSNRVDVEVGQPVRSVLVQPNPLSVKVGATTQLTFAAVDQFGTRSTRFTPVWSSANTAIATVSSTGVVTGKALGKTTISARINGITGSVPVTVGVTNMYISGPGQITTSGWYTFAAVVSPSGTYTYKWTVILYGHGVTQTFTINPLKLSVQAATGSLSLRVTVSQNGVVLGTATKVVQNSIPGSCGGRKCP